MESNYLGIGSRIRHPEFEEGVVIQVMQQSYLITFMKSGTKEISRSFPGLEVIEAEEASSDLVSLWDVEKSLTNILRKFSDIQERVELGGRWVGGTLIMKPGDQKLQAKEVPIDVFFNKIVMLRDRLRVLEQRVNAHEKLSEEDKVNMQQYITRCYGSLTTFNVLFKHSEDYFVGGKAGQ